MKLKFESRPQATEEAIKASKKTNSDIYVVLTKRHGLGYIVCDNVDELKMTDKVLSHFKEGKKVR